MRRGCYSPAALRAGRCQRNETPGWCRPPQGGERQPEAESGGHRSNPTRPAGDRTRRLHERFPALRTRAGGRVRAHAHRCQHLPGGRPGARPVAPLPNRCVVPCPGDEFFKDLSHGRRAGQPAHPRPRRHAATAGPLIVTIIFNPPVFFRLSTARGPEPSQPSSERNHTPSSRVGILSSGGGREWAIPPFAPGIVSAYRFHAAASGIPRLNSARTPGPAPSAANASRAGPGRGERRIAR